MLGITPMWLESRDQAQFSLASSSQQAFLNLMSPAHPAPWPTASRDLSGPLLRMKGTKVNVYTGGQLLDR